MKEEEIDFSNLTTVSVFDSGETSCRSFKNHEEIKSCSPSSLLIESLVAELSNFVEEDPQKQKKLYLSICRALRKMNLLGKSHERDDLQFMRSPYQQALYTLFNLAKITNVDKDIVIPKKFSGFPLPQVPSDIIKWSRYMLEFEELNYVAHGGFGSVFKARHRLDDNVYAVKKICLNAEEVKENITEVRTLAKLNHPNIVAYKAAWIELMEIEKNNLPSIQSSKCSSNKSKSKSSSDWIVFEKSQKNDEDDETSNSSNTPSSEPNENAMCRYEHKICEKYTSATLYIQMQFCEQTLRLWLDSRNSTETLDFTVCTDIFKKVVKGVEYIHSQGIVHHDINPNNIFISEDLREVQVGDFGLACCILAHQPQSIATSTHRKGTYLYAAPEQLMGTCNPKSDIYSLGIVLYELFLPFKTSMERVEMLEQLKSGKIPTELTAQFPNWAKIISQLVDIVDKRPTALELLSELEDSTNEKTQYEIKAQKEMIKLLRKESFEKDQEIAMLKRQLEELKTGNRIKPIKKVRSEPNLVLHQKEKELCN